MITRKELEDVLTQVNAILERMERRIEKLEVEISTFKKVDQKPVGRPKKTT